MDRKGGTHCIREAWNIENIPIYILHGVSFLQYVDAQRRMDLCKRLLNDVQGFTFSTFKPILKIGGLHFLSITRQVQKQTRTINNFAILVKSANRLDIHYILPITCFNKSLISPNSLDASSIERTLPVHSAIMYAQSNHNSCSDEAGRRTDNVALWIILRSIRSRPDPD
jgi:hypothetical protein